MKFGPIRTALPLSRNTYLSLSHFQLSALTSHILFSQPTKKQKQHASNIT